MCIDCRYPHVVHEYIRRNYPKELYDQIVLAGAALALTDSYTERHSFQTASDRVLGKNEGN
jgi:hypothetical protein